MHDEVFTKENCEMFSQFLETTPHENVRNKMLELVQTWAHAFRTTDKYQAIKVGDDSRQGLRSCSWEYTKKNAGIGFWYYLMSSIISLNKKGIS